MPCRGEVPAVGAEAYAHDLFVVVSLKFEGLLACMRIPHPDLPRRVRKTLYRGFVSPSACRGEMPPVGTEAHVIDITVVSIECLLTAVVDEVVQIPEFPPPPFALRRC